MRLRALLLAFAMIGGGNVALAQDGILDPSFGIEGLVTTNFPDGPDPVDSAKALVVLPDGRAVAAGATSPNLETSHMAVARYLFSGELDTSFGGDGLVTVMFAATDVSAGAGSVLRQADGRLVIVGGCYCDAAWRIALARLNINGSLDASFGTGGKVLTGFPGDVTGGLKGALQPDGRIVALGIGGTTQAPEVALARYDTDGSLDPTFGVGGRVTMALPFRPANLALQRDGKILVVGNSGPGGPPFIYDFGLIRLLPDGTPDPAFGTGGLVTSDFGGSEAGHAVVVLGNGRLVVGGSRSVSTATDFALVRYLPDGLLDTTFGTGGLVVADSGVNEYGEDLLLQPDGKLLLAGWRREDTSVDHDFLLARFHADGVLDPGFGTGGFVRTIFGTSWDDASAVAIAGPDLLLAAGRSMTAARDDFALARYMAVTPVELIGFGVE